MCRVRIRALRGQGILFFLVCVAIGVLIGVVWLLLHNAHLQVHVNIFHGRGAVVAARLKALDAMVSHQHVALGIAPPAFALVEYGGELTADLVRAILFLCRVSLSCMHVSVTRPHQTETPTLHSPPGCPCMFQVVFIPHQLLESGCAIHPRVGVGHVSAFMTLNHSIYTTEYSEWLHRCIICCIPCDYAPANMHY